MEKGEAVWADVCKENLWRDTKTVVATYIQESNWKGNRYGWMKLDNGIQTFVKFSVNCKTENCLPILSILSGDKDKHKKLCPFLKPLFGYE